MLYKHYVRLPKACNKPIAAVLSIASVLWIVSVQIRSYGAVSWFTLGSSTGIISLPIPEGRTVWFRTWANTTGSDTTVPVPTKAI